MLTFDPPENRKPSVLRIIFKKLNEADYNIEAIFKSFESEVLLLPRSAPFYLFNRQPQKMVTLKQFVGSSRRII